MFSFRCCQLDYSKCCERILTIFNEEVGYAAKRKFLDSGADVDCFVDCGSLFIDYLQLAASSPSYSLDDSTVLIRCLRSVIASNYGCLSLVDY